MPRELPLINRRILANTAVFDSMYSVLFKDKGTRQWSSRDTNRAILRMHSGRQDDEAVIVKRGTTEATLPEAELTALQVTQWHALNTWYNQYVQTPETFPLMEIAAICPSVPVPQTSQKNEVQGDDVETTITLSPNPGDPPRLKMVVTKHVVFEPSDFGAGYGSGSAKDTTENTNSLLHPLAELLNISDQLNQALLRQEFLHSLEIIRRQLEQHPLASPELQAKKDSALREIDELIEFMAQIAPPPSDEVAQSFWQEQGEALRARLKPFIAACKHVASTRVTYEYDLPLSDADPAPPFLVSIDFSDPLIAFILDPNREHLRATLDVFATKERVQILCNSLSPERLRMLMETNQDPCYHMELFQTQLVLSQLAQKYRLPTPFQVEDFFKSLVTVIRAYKRETQTLPELPVDRDDESSKYAIILFQLAVLNVQHEARSDLISGCEQALLPAFARVMQGGEEEVDAGTLELIDSIFTKLTLGEVSSIQEITELLGQKLPALQRELLQLSATIKDKQRLIQKLEAEQRTVTALMRQLDADRDKLEESASVTARNLQKLQEQEARIRALREKNTRALAALEDKVAELRRLQRAHPNIDKELLPLQAKVRELRMQQQQIVSLEKENLRRREKAKAARDELVRNERATAQRAEAVAERQRVLADEESGLSATEERHRDLQAQNVALAQTIKEQRQVQQQLQARYSRTKQVIGLVCAVIGVAALILGFLGIPFTGGLSAGLWKGGGALLTLGGSYLAGRNTKPNHGSCFHAACVVSGERYTRVRTRSPDSARVGGSPRG